MIEIDTIQEIIATYQKYGWVLRRILVSGHISPATASALPGLYKVTVAKSDISAAWFSRPPANGSVAWEIRFLGETPFALIESLDEKSPDFESSLRAAETRLREAVASKQSA